MAACQHIETNGQIDQRVALRHSARVGLSSEEKQRRSEERLVSKARLRSIWAARLEEYLISNDHLSTQGRPDSQWLAQAIGVDKTTANRWLTGNRSPTPEQAVKLETLLKQSGQTRQPGAIVNSSEGTFGVEDMAILEKARLRVEAFLRRHDPQWLTPPEKEQLVRFAAVATVDLSDPFLEQLARSAKTGFAFTGAP